MDSRGRVNADLLFRSWRPIHFPKAPIDFRSFHPLTSANGQEEIQREHLKFSCSISILVKVVPFTFYNLNSRRPNQSI